MIEHTEIIKALEVGVSCLRNILYIVHSKNPSFESAPCFFIPYDRETQLVSMKEGGVCETNNKWEHLQGIFLESTSGGYFVCYLEEGCSWQMFQGYPFVDKGAFRFPAPVYQGFLRQPEEITLH